MDRPTSSLRRLVLALLLLAPASASAQGPVRARAGQVFKATGTIEVQHGLTAPWITVKAGDELRSGDSLRTDRFSIAQITFVGTVQWELKERSLLDVKEVLAGGTDAIQLRLSRGTAVSTWTPDRRKVALTMGVETPSAQLGIRGTEYSIHVDDNGDTKVLVLDGTVEVTNDRGTVLAGENETAEAGKGTKPTMSSRVLNPSDRVQWIAAYTPAPMRYAVNASPEVQTVVRDAAVAYAAGRTEDALNTLDQRAQDVHDPAIWLAWADLFLGVGDYDSAASRASGGQGMFPSDGRFDALLARIALFRGLPAESKAKADDAIAKDPRSVDGWLALGDWAALEGNAIVARRAFTQATTIDQADARGWFGLGHVATEREEFASARQLLGKALRLDPKGPGYRGELGTLDTLANRLRPASDEYAKALQVSPDDYIALTGRALVALKQGREAEAIELLLHATLLEMRYARAHLYLAIAYYRLQRVDDALKELKRASAIDPRDPVPYVIRSAIATDLFQPAQAIAAARTAAELMPNLKSLNQIANDQKGTANVGNAMAFFGMEDWALHLAQESYAPAWAGSHLFVADRYTTNFAKTSEYIHGLLADPTAFGGSPTFQTLLPRPATYVTAGMLIGRDSDSHQRMDPAITLSGYANSLTPIGYAVQVDIANRTHALTDRTDTQVPRSVVAGIGTALSPAWNLFGTGTYTDMRNHETYTFVYPELQWSLFAHRVEGGAQYHPTPASALSVKAGTGTQNVDFPTLPQQQRMFFAKDNGDLQINQRVLLGGRHELSTGVEFGRQSTAAEFLYDCDGRDPDGTVDVDGNCYVGKQVQQSHHYAYNATFEQTSQVAFVADQFKVNRHLTLDGALFVERNTAALREAYGLVPAVASAPERTFTDSDNGVDLRPRAGAVVRGGAAVFRIAYQDWQKPRGTVSTLAPVATAGIPLDDTLVLGGGELRRLRGQFEWEVSPRTFAVAFADHQDARNELNLEFRNGVPQRQLEVMVNGLRDAVRDASRLNVANESLVEGTPIFTSGHLTTTGVTINQLVTRELSAYAQYRYTDSVRDPEAGFSARALPFSPQNLVALGVTWVSPARVYFSAQTVHRDGRVANDKDSKPGSEIAPNWSSRIGGSWETRSKLWTVEFVALNLAPGALATYSVNIKLRR